MTPGRLAELLALHDAPDALVLARGPGRRVTRVRDGYDDVAVKTFAATGLRRVARALLGSRAERAARAAERLRAAGLGAPEVLGVVEEPGRSALVTRWVDGPDLQAALGLASPADATRLAVAASVFAARMHGAGLACRDLKPPNLVVRGWTAHRPGEAIGGQGPGLGSRERSAGVETRGRARPADEVPGFAAGVSDRESGPIELVLVDLEDVARAGPRAWRGRWRNLAALDAYGQLHEAPIGVRPRVAALQAYATTSGLDAREVLRAVLPRSRAKRRTLVGRARAPLEP